MPAFPKVMFPVVDIRDVAEAHLKAIKIKNASNQRILIVYDTYKLIELSNILK